MIKQIFLSCKLFCMYVLDTQQHISKVKYTTKTVCIKYLNRKSKYIRSKVFMHAKVKAASVSYSSTVF